MRVSIKNDAYFKSYIQTNDLLHERRKKKLSDNIIAPERIEIVKADMSKNKLYQLIAKFSAGYSLNELFDDYDASISLAFEGWKKEGSWLLKNKQGEQLNQYTFSAYNQMLVMLSLGYLLNVSDKKFQLLVDIIDRDNVKDLLFEFIISAKLKDRKLFLKESYREYFFIPNAFDSLRKITKESSKDEAISKVKEYLTNEWYNIQADTGIKDNHLNSNNLYYGYWSFESAAIVKIMGLDDSSFIDHQYYPKDLVHQVPESPKKKGLLGRLGF